MNSDNQEQKPTNSRPNGGNWLTAVIEYIADSFLAPIFGAFFLVLLIYTIPKALVG